MFEGYETDKSEWHEYGKVYEELYDDSHKVRRFDVSAVMELGIDRGGSLRAWRDYFPNAEIVGMDIDPQTMVHGEDRITTFTGNVRNKHDLRRAAGHVTPYDLIVDDASHLPFDQFNALKVLWPYLMPGGFYCIEDLDLNRQGSDILLTCHLIVRETCRHLDVYLGTEVANDDILILEKTA